MKCNGNFTYKSIEKKDGGEFVNDKGQSIKYEPSYSIKVDELSGDTITERKFKFSAKNTNLADKFKQFKPYDKISIDFEVSLYNNVARIVPIDTNYFIDELDEADY